MFFKIKLYLHLNCVLMLNRIVLNRTIFIKMDLALSNLQRLICHKTQINKQTNKRTLLCTTGIPFSKSDITNILNDLIGWLVGWI